MDYRKVTYLTSILFGLLFLLSCKAKYLTVAPVPANGKTVSQELEYMVNTDQTDRRKGLFAIVTNSKRGKLIQQRDSIRGNRVYQFYKIDSIKTDENKFNAGVILIHSNDTNLRKICYNIFNDLEKNGTTLGGRMNGKNWKKLVCQ